MRDLSLPAIEQAACTAIDKHFERFPDDTVEVADFWNKAVAAGRQYREDPNAADQALEAMITRLRQDPKQREEVVARIEVIRDAFARLTLQGATEH